MEAQATATVKEALAALYHHPDDTIRTAADRWLQKFQHTPDAWQVRASAQFGSCPPHHRVRSRGACCGWSSCGDFRPAIRCAAGRIWACFYRFGPD